MPIPKIRDEFFIVENFVDQKDELTLELDRFIYGLKQAPYKFQCHVKAFLLRIGYKQQPQDD